MKRISVTLKKVNVKFVDTKSYRIVDKRNKSYINIKCYDNFINLLSELNKQCGNIYFTDMYRTFEEQNILRAKSIFAARPMRSLHLYGKAFDVSVFLLGKKYNLFADIAKSYDFFGISNEPWHFQYCENTKGPFYELEYMVKDYLPLSKKDIEEHLNFAGFGSSVNDIKAFQKRVCINADGIIGHETQKMLLLYNTEFEFIE